MIWSYRKIFCRILRRVNFLEMFVKVITTKEGSAPAEAVLLKESLRLYRYRYRKLNSIHKVSASCGLNAWSGKLVYNGLDGNKYTVFFQLSAHDRLSAHPLFFTVRGGTASATLMKNLTKPSPRRSKKSEITYLSSCRVCKPALKSAVCAVPSGFRCSYSSQDCNIDQSTILLHVGLLRQASERAEQWERESTIMADTLRSAIMKLCSFTEISQTLPALCS